MKKIIAPNTEYNGESAGVTFENGVGQTDDPNLISWFKEHGYKVEDSPAETDLQKVTNAEKSEEPKDSNDPLPSASELSKMNKSQLCAIAEQRNIKVVPDEMTKAQIIAAITAE